MRLNWGNKLIFEIIGILLIFKEIKVFFVFELRICKLVGRSCIYLYCGIYNRLVLVIR